MVFSIIRTIIGVSVVVVTMFMVSSVHAATWNRHFIISDQEFFDETSMTLDEIQRFLERKQSFLARYKINDNDKTVRSAAEIIYNAAKKYIISPQTLLVTLQKEQSLIEGSSPTTYNLTWATGFARCDSCDPENPGISQYGGFEKQVDRTAWRFRYYVEHPNEFNFRIGQVATVDGEIVVPSNQATVNLYNYTPHLHGNENFWELWQRYFARQYPDGTLVQEKGSPGVWLIQHGLKRPFLTKSALTSRFDISKIMQVEKADLDKYDTGLPIKFPQYAILRSPGGTVYLIDGDTKRGFSSREAFRMTGINPDEILDVEWDDLALYAESNPITSDSHHPTGVLLQDTTNGSVYYVQDGKRHPLWSRDILTTRFPHLPIIPETPEELESYTLSDPIGFEDGELVTSTKTNQVFIISNNKKHPFVSAEVFNALGYRWNKIITTTDEILRLHETGSPITL